MNLLQPHGGTPRCTTLGKRRSREFLGGSSSTTYDNPAPAPSTNNHQRRTTILEPRKSSTRDAPSILKLHANFLSHRQWPFLGCPIVPLVKAQSAIHPIQHVSSPITRCQQVRELWQRPPSRAVRAVDGCFIIAVFTGARRLWSCPLLALLAHLLCLPVDPSTGLDTRPALTLLSTQEQTRCA